MLKEILNYFLKMEREGRAFWLLVYIKTTSRHLSWNYHQGTGAYSADRKNITNFLGEYSYCIENIYLLSTIIQTDILFILEKLRSWIQ